GRRGLPRDPSHGGRGIHAAPEAPGAHCLPARAGDDLGPEVGARGRVADDRADVAAPPLVLPGSGPRPAPRPVLPAPPRRRGPVRTAAAPCARPATRLSCRATRAARPRPKAPS